MKHSRRRFLKTSAVAASAVAAPYFPLDRKSICQQRQERSAHDRLHRRGQHGSGDARAHSGHGDIVAVCDVDSSHADRAKNDPKIGKGKADVYGDYRKVLERNDIDVVSIVTPDHWHIKIAVEALQAGKHIFIQKPLTLTLEENQIIRAACKKYNKQAFQVGTQQRSTRHLFMTPWPRFTRACWAISRRLP